MGRGAAMTLSDGGDTDLSSWLSASSRPASWSDLRLLAGTVRLAPAEDQIIVTCAGRPDFVFGNYLVLRDPPASGDFAVRAERWTAPLRAIPGVQRVAVQWEGASELRGVEPAGWALDRSVVLALPPHRLATLAPGADARVRPVSLREEGEAVLSVIAQGFDTDCGRGSFERWRLGEYARVVDAGRGRWFGAWVGSTMAATVGIFDCDGILRFQYLVTAPPRRGEGLGEALCRAALASYSGAQGLRAVAVAEPDGAAERLYRRLGYQRVGWQVEWVAGPP